MTGETPIRVLIAKPGLDGHDRGAKVLARGLRDEGFEVIYTGLRQTPEMIADAAEQEDVDVVGLSILSGAHMALLPRTIELLRERGMDDVLVAAGGIIPDADVGQLKAAGVAEIFGPGTSIGQIARYFREHARRQREGCPGPTHMRPMAELFADLAGGGRRPLARLLTRIENGDPSLRGALPELFAAGHGAHIVGVTGPPGSGKSTLVNALISEWRRRGRRVGILAVDPSSPFTRGAILGDRIRMMEHAADRDVFMRSMASRGELGGLAATTWIAAAALDAAGFDPVLIETVGAGQARGRGRPPGRDDRRRRGSGDGGRGPGDQGWPSGGRRPHGRQQGRPPGRRPRRTPAARHALDGRWPGRA